MKEIKLSSGETCLVDDEDFDFVGQWRWKHVRSKMRLYAGRNVRNGRGGFGAVLMHRLLMGALKGQQVDHIDRNGLNNCRSNLRLCTQSENNANSRRQSNKKTSRFKGVGTWNHGGFSYWTAGVKKDGKRLHFSYHKTEEDAAKMYDEIARATFGPFARLNFPRDGEQSAFEPGVRGLQSAPT